MGSLPCLLLVVFVFIVQGNAAADRPKFSCDPECLNGGTCIGEDECACGSGWRGSTCHIAICDEPCVNGGACVTPNVCNCPTAFKGKTCNTEISIMDQEFDMLLPGNKLVARSLIMAPRLSTQCATWGETHYRTFDGRHFDFLGNCTYALAKDCRVGSDQYAIYVENGACSNGAKPCHRAVVLYADNKVYRVATGDVVTVDGKRVSLPLKEYAVAISKILTYVIIRALGNNIEIKFDGEASIYVALAEKYRNITCGLCGNFNGASGDDFKMPSGLPAKTTIDFGNSWSMASEDKPCAAATEEPADICKRAGHTVYTAAKRWCSVIHTHAFVPCHKKVSPDDFIKKCEEDVCSCGHANPAGCVCEALTQYSRTCASLKVKLNWRSEYLCPKNCSNNKVYDECGSTCPISCERSEAEADCKETCIDGCRCRVGTVQSGNECVPKSQCPCKDGDKNYAVGDIKKVDCNNCTCQGGQWHCTTYKCSATCYTYGNSYYVTFDGKAYSFKGNCKYKLVEERNDVFSVMIDTTFCAKDGKGSCLKSAQISYNNVSIDLVAQRPLKDTVNVYYSENSKNDGNIFNNLPLPVYDKKRGFSVRKLSSSLVEFVGDSGVRVVWDGQTNLFVTLNPNLSDNVDGLCGNFNFNTEDDFGIEDSPINFGNKWKDPVSKCPDVSTNLGMSSCELYDQNKKYAESQCSKLEKAPFTACHKSVDPTQFVENCKEDVCACDGKPNCLCSVLEAYARLCAEKGLRLDWQTNGTCASTCPHGMVFKACGSYCTTSCRDLSMTKKSRCQEKCVAGCQCPAGQLFDKIENKCVKVSFCPCYDDKGIHHTYNSVISKKCNYCACKSGQFVCTNKTCKAHIPCFRGKVWKESGAQCVKTCNNMHLGCSSHIQKSGCGCPEWLVEENGTCILPNRCPCYYNGKIYENGYVLKKECNTCKCKNSDWKCTGKRCKATCSVFGDSHYKTFDGKLYEFQGDCSYVLATDKCPGSSIRAQSFRIDAESIPCGSTGVTCTKSVTMTLYDTVIHMVRGKEKPTEQRIPSLSQINAKKLYRIFQSGVYVIIKTTLGLNVFWDRGTNVYIELIPNSNFWGKVCGLCGNFDGDMSNDFTTKQGLPRSSAQVFGDSWRVRGDCSTNKEKIHPCKVNKHRVAGSHKACRIIMSAKFQDCHKKLDPKPYYDRCVYDTCGCDMVGDCECTCEAIAAYAYMCLEKQVIVDWRTGFGKCGT